jgi:hypothetical protein
MMGPLGILPNLRYGSGVVNAMIASKQSDWHLGRKPLYSRTSFTLKDLKRAKLNLGTHFIPLIRPLDCKPRYIVLPERPWRS